MAQYRSVFAGWVPRPLVRASMVVHGAAVAALALPDGAWFGVAAVVANHAVLAACSLWPQGQAAGRTLVRLPSGQARGGVALTFDDGPDPEITPRVLDMLDAYGARASFFVVGWRAARYPALVAEIARRGHAVENHTWSHSWAFALLGPRAMAREIARGQAVVRRITGTAPRWVRAPAGLRSPLLDPALVRTGVAHASWTRRGFDTACAEPARVLARLTRGLREGDVLLLHDTGPMVLAVLPGVLAAIGAAGLSAVRLPPPVAGVPVRAPGTAPSGARASM